jgi:superfamily II DNA or RNA helicase
LLLDKTKNIILLADRTTILKKLLKYFPEEAGLFIGSCKPDQLLAAKEKRLLLATYAMASEGFSLEKLNCLVFATPRSSITQALGRIYRKRHSTTPVIVDIIDNFSIFKGQSFKRKKIYKESIENPYFLEKSGSNPKKDPKNGKVLVIDIFEDTEECLIED